jgi:plastocyanin
MPRRRLAALVPLLAILAATVLAAAPAQAGGGCHAPATDARGSTVALSDLCFSPTVLRVAPGSEVTFVNQDTITHPLSRPGGDWYWDGNGGARTTVRMDEAGTYPFFCYAHPGMVGVVVVGDGRGLGAGVDSVASASGPAAAPAGAGQPAQPTTAAGGLPQVPATWLVLVALAGLVGVVTGTRLAGRSRAGDAGSGARDPAPAGRSREP